MNWKRLYLITCILFCVYIAHTQRLLSQYETVNNKLQRAIVNLMTFCIAADNKGLDDLNER